MSCNTLLSSPPNRDIFQTKNFNFKALYLRKILVARLFMGVSLIRNVDQQNCLFRFSKDQLFLFYRAHSRLFGSQSRLQINFQVNMDRKQKELRNVTGFTCLFFRHDYRILKLRIICRGTTTRSVLVCKSSVYLRAPHFVCSGDGARQIIIFKTKIKQVSINAAANCNEHIV